MHLVRSSWLARALSRALLLMLVVLLAAAVFLPWQQTSRGEGEVTARLPQLRLQAVESPAKGIIASVRDDLREGSIVEAGEIIMEIKPYAEDAERLTGVVVRAQEEKLRSYRTIFDNMLLQVATVREQGQQEIASGEADVRSAANGWDKSIREVDEQLPKFNQAKLERERYKGLERDLISEVDFSALEQKELSELGKLEGAMASAKKAYNDLESKERLLEGKRRSVEQKILQAQSYVDKAQTDVNTAQKELNEVLTKQGEFDRLKVPSPSRGRIQAIRGQAGTNSVKEGDKLFEVVPETDDLAVELTVRGIDAPLIHVDDPVRLQFEGWPAIQFVGWPSVAVGTFPGKVIAIHPTDSGKGIFKIVVGPVVDRSNGNDGKSSPTEPFPTQNPWPDSRYLRQGVRANGWVILRTVPLWYEIWRQINGFPISISESEPGESKSKAPKPPKVK
jgi:multidrug resistance efflux pump